MEWTELLNYIFGGTSLVGLATTLIFWSKSKRAKEAETVTAESNAQQSKSEAEQADIETQRAKIDLGNKYIEDTMAMLEKIKQSQDRGENNQDKILEKLNTLDQRVDKLEINYSNLERWANGDYHSWLAQQEKGETKYEQIS